MLQCRLQGDWGVRTLGGVPGSPCGADVQGSLCSAVSNGQIIIFMTTASCKDHELFANCLKKNRECRDCKLATTIFADLSGVSNKEFICNNYYSRSLFATTISEHESPSQLTWLRRGGGEGRDDQAPALRTGPSGDLPKYPGG